MPLLHYLSYAAILAGFAFVTLSLASGLLYVSELIEEHSRTAKVVGKWAIYTIIVLHCLLCLSEPLPTWHTLFSIICHIVYLQNFSHTWPVISLTSPSFLASCVLVIADHFMWFFYFARITHDARHTSHQRTYGTYKPANHVPGFAEIATFFGVCVWLAPLFLFLSLSANDNALPTSAAPSSSQNDVRQDLSTSSRSSLFKSIFSNLLAILPVVRTSSEGIIASHSPLPSNSFRRDSGPALASRSHQNIPLLPPRSPGPPTNSIMNADSQSEFRLGTPPKRSPPTPRLTADGASSGLRRTATYPDREKIS